MSLKVLIVDDEEELVSTLGERLTLRGFEVDGVLTGDDALRRVGEKDFDVVILDIKMPGMDGLEVMKRIRAIRRGLQVILLTGRGSDKESERGLTEGAFAYLVKPIDIDDLMDKMRKAVDA